MKNTQKGLLLAVMFSLASGQALQAYWREKAHKSYEYLKTAPQKLKEKAKTTWASFDDETQQSITNAAIAAGALAATGVVAGVGYAAHSATQTDSTWKWGDPTTEKAAFDYLIQELTQPGYKGIPEAQEGYLNQRFPKLTADQKRNILDIVKEGEKEQAK